MTVLSMLSTEAQRQYKLDQLRKRAQKKSDRDLPSHWRDWLPALFPRTFSAAFADRQAEFWEWVDAIEIGKTPTPPAFFAIWPRGSGKTTSGEAAAVRVAAKGTRNFILYVRGNQDKANESVSNIGALLETREIAHHYPLLAKRRVGKYGQSKGWRMDMLRTASGFNVLGLGLDAAVRGVKLDDFRPDLIIFDDIDDKQDSPLIIKKKINTLTTSIIPAGSYDCAYLGLQNLIHAQSIFNMVVENTADFLYDRTVSGPHPAVEGLAYEARPEGGYRVIGGKPTWPAGQDLETVERQINLWGLSSFLQEAQHEVEESGGLWDHIEFRHIQFDELPAMERGEVWVDPAVTTTDDSDSMAIAAGGVSNKTLYVFHTWEQITTPEDVIKRAILLAIRYGFEAVGVETDQGGDTWATVYRAVCQQLLDDPAHPEIADQYDPDTRAWTRYRFPMFKQAKAGAGHGSKAHRNGQMQVDYEHGKVVHVIGTHKASERALRRFPKKPLDLADAMYWLWNSLMRGGSPNSIPDQPDQESKWKNLDKPSRVAGRWRM